MQSPQEYIRSYVRVLVVHPEKVNVRIREDPIRIDIQVSTEDLAQITVQHRESIVALCRTMGLKRGAFDLKVSGV
jgi:predicted RNA-binding protein YlqC (UPF0109 family)